jgi:signal peptidase II
MGYLIIAVFIFALDGVVKNLIEKRRKLGEETPVCKGRIIIRKYHNRGVALDGLQRWPWLVRLVSGGVWTVLVILWAVLLKKRGKKARKLGLSMIIGGGASNLHDRLTRGYVVDYFSIRCPWKWFQRIIFNLSDWCIFLGGVLLMCEK